jgi:multisubunit Na+/H+ antiporter MnhG subunit
MPSTQLSNIPRWQCVVVLVTALCSLLAAIGAWRLPEKGTFLFLFIKQDIPASFIVLAIVLCAVFCVDEKGRMVSFFDWVAFHSRLLSLAAFLTCGLGAWFIYHHQPLSMDEYSAVAQSQIFASGHLTGKIPRELTDTFLPRIYHDWFFYISDITGEIISVYWPGFPLVMAPFSFFGVPWLCNPALTALTILALSKLLEEIVTDPTARGFALFSAFASPAVLINGMAYFGMPLQLLCSLVFTIGLINGTTRWLLTAGLAAAIGLTAVNPVPVGLYALPWVVWAVVNMRRQWRKLGLLAVFGLPLALLLGVGWKLLAISQFPPVQQAGVGTSLQSMIAIFKAPTMTMLAIRIIGLLKIYFWAVPGLPILACLAFRPRGREKWQGLMAASAVVLLAGFLFVPFDQGNGWGYRYFHAAWFVLPVMSAIALQKFASEPGMRKQVYGFAFAAAVGSLVLLSPFTAYKVESYIGDHLEQVPARLPGSSRQVVFIRLYCGSSSIDLIQNDPFLRSNEIHLMSNGYEEDKRIAALLGDKPRLVSSASCADRWLVNSDELRDE